MGIKIKKLEITVVRIDERIHSIHENVATKTDIAHLKTWFLLTAVTLGIAAAGAFGAVVAVFRLIP